MKADVKVPSMGESISEATIATIIKQTGSKVSMDDEILELETDKVNQVLYAPQAGILTLNVTPGQTVTIGQVLGSVDSDGQEAAPKQEASPEPKQEEPKKVEATERKEQPAKTEVVEKKAIPKSEGKSARLGKDEFVKNLQQPAEKQDGKGTESKAGKDPRESRRKMSNIRKVIASRMVEVKNTTAMLTTFNEVDMSQIIALRDNYKEAFQQRYGVKLGFMSFFVKACVSALQHFPDVNSYIDGDEIVHRDYYDIGMAVGTDRGVMVPVVRDCDQLSYPDIELAIEQYAKKARDGSISVNDLQGGSFTITNGGVYGSMLSTPIINPNQSAILGLHKISKRAVVVDDKIVIRPIMYLALSYDHRIIDGKEAVSFLVHVKNALEYPASSLLGL